MFGANSSQLVHRRQRERVQSLKLLQQRTESVQSVASRDNLRLAIDQMEKTGSDCNPRKLESYGTSIPTVECDLIINKIPG
jgi:hypothetical protein